MVDADATWSVGLGDQVSRASREVLDVPGVPGYRWVRQLSVSEYAQVHLFRKRRYGHAVAVKVLRATSPVTGDPQALQRYAERMSMIAEHPCVVPLRDAALTDEGRAYLVFDYYPGANLAERAVRDTLLVADVLDLGIHLCDAVHSAHHSEVVHGNIKPSNILTDRQHRLGLTDFGIGGHHHHVDANAGRGRIWPSPWSAPEVASATQAPDERSDVYSLGATLWTLLVGRAPFDGARGTTDRNGLARRIRDFPAPRTRRTDVPDALERVLQRAMAKSPESRYPSALALAEALERIRTGDSPRIPYDGERGTAGPSSLSAAPDGSLQQGGTSSGQGEARRDELSPTLRESPDADDPRTGTVPRPARDHEAPDDPDPAASPEVAAHPGAPLAPDTTAVAPGPTAHPDPAASPDPTAHPDVAVSLDEDADAETAHEATGADPRAGGRHLGFVTATGVATLAVVVSLGVSLVSGPSHLPGGRVTAARTPTAEPSDRQRLFVLTGAVQWIGPRTVRFAWSVPRPDLVREYVVTPYGGNGTPYEPIRTPLTHLDLGPLPPRDRPCVSVAAVSESGLAGSPVRLCG